jgi:hypothetical protein
MRVIWRYRGPERRLWVRGPNLDERRTDFSIKPKT